jgi:hypothetical protein
MRKIPLAWEFEGSCIRCISHVPMDNGYVYVRGGGRFWSIPRRIAFKRHGELPYEVVCRHSCDNRWCINPAHIDIGTRGDNRRDSTIRGRDVRGEVHHSAKLTESDIRDIRNSALSNKELSEIYRVSHSQIWEIRTHRAWVHV